MFLEVNIWAIYNWRLIRHSPWMFQLFDAPLPKAQVLADIFFSYPDSHKSMIVLLGVKEKTCLTFLVLKSARRIGSQSARRKAWGEGPRIMDAKRTSMQKCFISLSDFTKHILQKQVRLSALKKWLDIKMTTNTTNKHKVCYLIIVVP